MRDRGEFWTLAARKTDRIMQETTQQIHGDKVDQIKRQNRLTIELLRIILLKITWRRRR